MLERDQPLRVFLKCANRSRARAPDRGRTVSKIGLKRNIYEIIRCSFLTALTNSSVGGTGSETGRHGVAPFGKWKRDFQGWTPNPRPAHYIGNNDDITTTARTRSSARLCADRDSAATDTRSSSRRAYLFRGDPRAWGLAFKEHS